VVDTNHSPIGIDYVIPGNDDSSKAVTLYARGIADAILEGRNTAASDVVKAVSEGSDEFVRSGRRRRREIRSIPDRGKGLRAPFFTPNIELNDRG